jgi:hypothetical protein
MTSVPKSYVTVDMAFQKDLTLQGCTTLPTCADWLLTPESLALFHGKPVEGGRPWPLPYFCLDHESHPKDCSAVTGQVPKSVLKVVYRDQDYECRAFLNPGHIPICGDPGLPSGIPVMHTIHDPRKTVMNPHNRAGISEYIIHNINRSQSLTWPLGRI